MIKKFLKNSFFIVGDIFLLSFLLIIFVVPVLVSFNLDPKLKSNADTTQSNILGTRDETNILKVHEAFAHSNSISIRDSVQETNLYRIDIRINGNSYKNQTLKIGKIENLSDETETFTLDFNIIKGLLEDTRVYLYLNSDKYLLFDYGKANTIKIDLEQNEEKDLSIMFNSTNNFNTTLDTNLSITK